MPRAFTDSERSHIRDRLLEAGREALPHTGFRRTSVETLARRAGISKGAFYGFYSTKEALFLELLQEAEARLRAELLERARDAARTPPERLSAVVHRIFTALSDHPILAALTDPEDLAWLERTLPPGAMEAARADDDRWFRALWDELVASGAGDPSVDPDDFVGLAPAALALALGWRGLKDPRGPRTTRWLADAAVQRLSAQTHRSDR